VVPAWIASVGPRAVIASSSCALPVYAPAGTPPMALAHAWTGSLIDGPFGITCGLCAAVHVSAALIALACAVAPRREARSAAWSPCGEGWRRAGAREW